MVSDVKLEQQSPSSPKKAGQLVIIGGAEDKDGDCKILREFVRNAGGTQAQLIIMTVATELPQEVGENYIRVFKKLGVEDIRIVDTVNREEAEEGAALSAIQKATGVFFTGGNQSRITEVLKDTKIHNMLHQRYAEGIVVGGTSAGASMMSNTMILEGEGETHPRPEIVDLDEGMDFMSGVIIDQHFSQRGRLGRLLAAVANHPNLLGIGIDENTAIVVQDNQFKVVGGGACTIVDMKQATHNNVETLLKDEGLALSGVTLHNLPDGYSFDLKKRSLIAP